MNFSYCNGIPSLSGRIRVQPEDFQVTEELGFKPSGAGEHVLLRVRKRTVNTAWVARQLATCAKVPPIAVGYAGLKDRHALAEQWFSVHLPKTEPDWKQCANTQTQWQILEIVRHARKLQRGALSGNRFRIVIRELLGDCAELESRLARIAQRGVPNYFGEQRFGYRGANLGHAKALLSGRQHVRDRHLRGLYLSAARAYLFNRVLSARVAAGTWNRALAGDLMQLDGSRSVFAIDADALDAEIERRLAAFDIHPTGPLWGSGEPPSGGAVRALELSSAAELDVFCQGLAQAGMRQERRALRLCPQALSWERPEPSTLVLTFRLPPGAFATAVLRELIRWEVT